MAYVNVCVSVPRGPYISVTEVISAYLYRGMTAHVVIFSTKMDLSLQ